jgi:hypothetical protein
MTKCMVLLSMPRRLAFKRVVRRSNDWTYGLRLKADVMMGTWEFYGLNRNSSFIGDAYRLAENVMALTLAAEGNRS